jgi:hypothetical protein
MNERQLLAYENPCQSREELLAQATDKQRRYVHLQDLLLSTFLTVDKLSKRDGSTRIYWHASVAVLNQLYQPQRVETISFIHQLLIQAQLKAMLIGVGDPVMGEYWVKGKHALHLYRALSQEEIAGLKPEFVSTASVNL